MSPGARAAMRSASPIVSCVMNWDECAKARRFAWRVITSAISGTPWPMEQTTAPPQPSRYLRPPLSWIQIPSARTATGYRSLRFRGKRCVTPGAGSPSASSAPEGASGDREASEVAASAPGAGAPGTGPAAGFLTIAGEGRERGRDAACLSRRNDSPSSSSSCVSGSSSSSWSARSMPICSASFRASSARNAGSSRRDVLIEAAALAVALASADSSRIGPGLRALFAATLRPVPRCARFAVLRRSLFRFMSSSSLAGLRFEEDALRIELPPDDPDLLRGRGRGLRQVLHDLDFPADVLLDRLQRDAGMDRVQDHLPCSGVETVHAHVGDHQLRAARKAERLALAPAAQVAGAGDEVHPLGKSALRVGDRDHDPLRQSRDLAGTAAPGQPDPRFPVVPDDGRVD